VNARRPGFGRSSASKNWTCRTFCSTGLGFYGSTTGRLVSPTTLFIARDGKLVDAHVGEISRELFERKIADLQRE